MQFITQQYQQKFEVVHTFIISYQLYHKKHEILSPTPAIQTNDGYKLE